MTEDDDGTQYGSSMHCHLENQIARFLHAENFASYHQMTAAAHRQELRQALDNPENNSFKPFHNI